METTRRVRPKAALIGHPPDADLFRSFVRMLRPDKTWRDELLVKLFEWAHPFQAGTLPDIWLSETAAVHGNVYMVPFLPEMREISIRRIIKKVEGSLKLAAEDGCSVAAMGAFTSIVLQGMEEELERKYGLRITSGNAFTAAVIIQSISDLLRRMNRSLEDMTVGIVGASGDIGSTCVGWFGSRVSRLILTGRGMEPLEKCIERQKDQIRCDYTLSTDNRAVVHDCDVVIYVTSSYTHLTSIEDFGPWTIVCDASSPLNVRWDPQNLRPDVLLYHGGIVGLPVPLETGFDIGLSSPYHFYGCQVEGLLVALDEGFPCSWGRGNITQEKLNTYIDAFRRYPGITPVFSCGNKHYTDSELKDFAAKCSCAAGIHPVSLDGAG